MSSPCDQLAAYVDGELEAAERDAFALHLAGCADCRDALHDALQLVALEAAARAQPDQPHESPVEHAERPRAVERARKTWWRRSSTIAFAVAAAAAIAFSVWWSRRGVRAPAEPAVVLAMAPARAIEGRISYAAADAHRPYDVARGASAAPAAETISLDTLARLEHRGDLHGVAAAYLLMNDAARATAYLDRAPASPDVASDRALIELAAGDAAGALIALDGVLATAPHHAQAMWNRALALRDLGLALSAAEQFEAVAALNEPGWSEEARARAKALSDQMGERKTAFQRLAFTDGPRLATAPDAVTAQTARRFPGMTRLMFYDAVRSAASADAVRALAPLAKTLDEVYGGAVLAGYVDKIARADFAVRAPLAQRYASLARGQRLDDAAAREFLAALRSAKQDDLLLGAILLTTAGHVPAALVPELSRLAEATSDPWFHLLGVEQAANALLARGEHGSAEVLLLPAFASCAASPIDYRCASLDLALGQSYLATLRLPDARRVLADGWARAQRAGEWNLQLRLLPLLAQLESLEDDVAGSTLPLVRAYTGELLLRDPKRCDFAVWSSELAASVLVNRVDLDGARAELAHADVVQRTCPMAIPSVTSVFVKAHALRDPHFGSAAAVTALRAEIAALRAAPSASKGVQAVLDQTEGRLMIDRDRATGTALLERAIAVARTADVGDIDAHKARSYAYSILTLDAGRAGEWDRVWQLLGEAAGITPAARCTLGAAVEDRSSLVVVRDAAGASRGVFDGNRPGPAIDATTLVPAALRDALQGCPSVEVVARPPVQGLPDLLPIDVAWSYRSGAGPQPGAVATGPVQRVVISGAEPPAALGLPRLVPWRSATSFDVVLDGAAATPSRALTEMGSASYVEIHAHGIVNAAESDASFLMLSPEPDGRYALTAAAIREQPLHGRPIVVLAACHAAVTARYRHEAWNLPAAFIAAGARAVVASTDVISDADAGAFFDDMRARIERGASPAVALRDARSTWLAAHPAAAWVRSLMVFD